MTSIEDSELQKTIEQLQKHNNDLQNQLQSARQLLADAMTACNILKQKYEQLSLANAPMEFSSVQNMRKLAFQNKTAIIRTPRQVKHYIWQDGSWKRQDNLQK